MSICLLAYPNISTSDYKRIQEFRKHNDELYFRVVEPHFTLVFPLSGLELEPFIAEIKKQVRGFRSFDFCIRCSTLNKDAFNDSYHAFLVPDEGYSHLVKLHDRIYADRLFPYRALEVDFIPHIGIGNSKDPLKCIEMVNRWNSTEFAIPGHVSELDIVSYENDIVQTVLRIPLGG
jgi:hypothetical protein